MLISRLKGKGEDRVGGDGSQAAPLPIRDDEHPVAAGSIINLLSSQAAKMYVVAGPMIPTEAGVSKESVNNLDVFHLCIPSSMIQATVVRAYLKIFLLTHKRIAAEMASV